MDLASRRRKDAESADLPAEVWQDVQAANRLWHELRDEGREVRFETPGSSGSVVASLRDMEGIVVRSLPLHTVIRMDDDGPSAA